MFHHREELRRWFIQQEMDLFRYRFTQLSGELTKKFLENVSLSYDVVSFTTFNYSVRGSVEMLNIWMEDWTKFVISLPHTPRHSFLTIMLVWAAVLVSRNPLDLQPCLIMNLLLLFWGSWVWSFLVRQQERCDYVVRRPNAVQLSKSIFWLWVLQIDVPSMKMHPKQID